MVRAKSYEEIKPLIELCQAGKLFDVQKWIACGKPVNAPPLPSKGHLPSSPLVCAIYMGFHSLVEVLLDAGATIEGTPDHRHCSDLAYAIEHKRFDIAKLLVTRGASVNCVDMVQVFETWNYDIVEFFIEHGADVETENPLAEAFCGRIRTALRAYKTYRDRFPSFREQANIALRYHCNSGNVKWAALMLWLGADPHARGRREVQSAYAGEDEDGDTAAQLAAVGGYVAILKLKAMRLNSPDVRRSNLFANACFSLSLEVLRFLLEKKYPVNDQENGGSSYATNIIETIDWCGRWQNGDYDLVKMRARFAVLEMLLQHGARWIPNETDDMNHIRRRLLLSAPEATLQVVRLMAKYQGCTRDTVELLLKTPAIQGHAGANWGEICRLVEALPR